MSYAIMRMEKLKGNLRGIGKHIDRSYNGTSISPSNANPNKIKNNIHWNADGIAYSQNEWTAYTKDKPLYKRIENKIKEKYTLKRQIRKDAVKAIEYIFTSDTLKMDEIMNDERMTANWMKDNKDFVAAIYGEENIISMHLHCDETTYHCEVVVVPITNDGRLSAKEFINGKKDLSAQQTSYAELMEKYGMERGQKGSPTKHQRPNSKNFNQSHNHVYNH